MYTIRVRNVHEALVQGIAALETDGVLRESRNGAVRMFPEPVATRYLRPTERVLFHSERDANPFFHLYESLWMLAGKRDVEERGALRQAYGHLQRRRQDVPRGLRLPLAQAFQGGSDRADHPTAGHEQRRSTACVLQMWDARSRPWQAGQRLPVQHQRRVQRQPRRKLDMTVFNRSNDMVWGAYGANAVHFSILQEYIACALGLKVGAY
jgi:hypothetical protein